MIKPWWMLASVSKSLSKYKVRLFIHFRNIIKAINIQRNVLFFLCHCFSLLYIIPPLCSNLLFLGHILMEFVDFISEMYLSIPLFILKFTFVRKLSPFYMHFNHNFRHTSLQKLSLLEI